MLDKKENYNTGVAFETLFYLFRSTINQFSRYSRFYIFHIGSYFKMATVS